MNSKNWKKCVVAFIVLGMLNLVLGCNSSSSSTSSVQSSPEANDDILYLTETNTDVEDRLVVSYDVSADGSAGVNVSVQVAPPASTIGDLTPGLWQVRVSAKNAEGIVIATGSTEILVPCSAPDMAGLMLSNYTVATGAAGAVVGDLIFPSQGIARSIALTVEPEPGTSLEGGGLEITFEGSTYYDPSFGDQVVFSVSDMRFEIFDNLLKLKDDVVILSDTTDIYYDIIIQAQMEEFSAEKDFRIALDAFLLNGVTAHRGYSGKYPQNTMDAFVAAVEAGADTIELDIHQTLDGKLVVIHDDSTGAYAMEDLVIAESTWEELRELDVAYYYRWLHPGYPVTHMPLLSEVLEFIMTQNSTKLTIEIKDDSSEKAVSLVHEYNAQAWAGFTGFSYEIMSSVKDLDPSLYVLWLDNPITCEEFQEDIELCIDAGFEAFGMNSIHFSCCRVAKLHEFGLESAFYTVNDPISMAILISADVDHIITNYAEKCLEVKEQL